MDSRFSLSVLLLSFFLISSSPLIAKVPQSIAVEGQVTGEVQKVGFRAHILKAAIRYNLAGNVKNNPDGSVSFLLQGTPERIEKALKEIRKGTKKSQVDSLKVSPAQIAPSGDRFTVRAWTSESRKITKPYDLIFVLRKKNNIISKQESKNQYHQILKDTLKGED